jgi:hypothetical protein
MATSHPRFTARIEGSPASIFDLIADMPNYGRWLPGSESLAYLDGGPAGKRPGSVTEYDPPKHIAFHHRMLLKRGPLTANIDVHIRYTFEPVDRATSVIRALDLAIQIPGLLKVAEPLVVFAFRNENVRILAELKRYVERKPIVISY